MPPSRPFGKNTNWPPIIRICFMRSVREPRVLIDDLSEKCCSLWSRNTKTQIQTQRPMKTKKSYGPKNICAQRIVCFMMGISIIVYRQQQRHNNNNNNHPSFLASNVGWHGLPPHKRNICSPLRMSTMPWIKYVFRGHPPLLPLFPYKSNVSCGAISRNKPNAHNNSPNPTKKYGPK